MNYSVSDQDILKLFPYPSFRPAQEKIILKVNSFLNSGGKVVLLNCPTGIGKSGIDMTFCRAMKSFYCTPQNSLIDQIKRDPFLSKYVVEIKGRRNYDCIKDYTGHSSVAEGMCTRFKGYIPTHCNHIAECPYYIQKAAALSASIILTNPTYLMLEGRSEDVNPPHLGIREMLVVDEGHSIEERIIDVSAVEIKPWILDNIRVPSIKTKDELLKFINEAYNVALFKLSQIETSLDLYGQITVEDVKFKDELTSLISKCEMCLNTFDSNEWLWETAYFTIKGKIWPYLKITPLDAGIFGVKFWNKATTAIIVSSATLFNPRVFTYNTGLGLIFKPDQIMYLEGPSIFPKENRPIIDMAVGYMTFQNITKNMDAACTALETILDMETGNVAIHIPSYELANKILKGMEKLNTKHKKRFITHSSADRMSAMTEWTKQRGMVFFAVAFTEGHDWKGDICEAQVLFKVPYPDINNRRVARMLEMKRFDWYNMKTVTTVIQSYGRAVRSETDVARFYVIDSSFWTLIEKTRKVIPSWFVEAMPKSRVK